MTKTLAVAAALAITMAPAKAEDPTNMNVGRCLAAQQDKAKSDTAFWTYLGMTPSAFIEGAEL